MPPVPPEGRSVIATKPEISVNFGYEKRMGSLAIVVRSPDQPDPVAFFRIPMSMVMKNLGIPPEALRRQALDARKPNDDAFIIENVLREGVPADCSGLTVLDVGGYDGRMAALAKERGAQRAICLDTAQWTHYGWNEKAKLQGVEYVTGDFREWSEPVDVVLFFNVLYHVENPWAALAHLRTIARREMVLCTLVVWDDRAVWEVYDPFEVNPKDDTVYWGPSETGLRKLLKLTGWTDVTEVGHACERLVLRCKP